MGTYATTKNAPPTKAFHYVIIVFNSANSRAVSYTKTNTRRGYEFIANELKELGAPDDAFSWESTIWEWAGGETHTSNALDYVRLQADSLNDVQAIRKVFERTMQTRVHRRIGYQFRVAKLS